MNDEEVEEGLRKIRAASLQAALDGDHDRAAKLRAVHNLVNEGRNQKQNPKK